MAGTMRAVVLPGKGFESITVRDLPISEPNDDQLLCRVDACTVCPSILKLISQGSEHAFLDGWDMARWPVILGDEGAVTVVKAGKNVAWRFPEGEKFAIQPAVDHPPVNFRDRYRHPDRIRKVAVGYTMGGTFAQYLLVLEEVIEAGCVVELPSQALGHYEVSLSEPLSCVVSSQDHHVHMIYDKGTGERVPKKGLLEGGVAVIFGAGVMARFHMELALTYKPRAVFVFARSEKRAGWVKRNVMPRARQQGVAFYFDACKLEDIPERIFQLTGQSHADDIIDTTASPEVLRFCTDRLTGKGTVVNTFGGLNIGEHIVGVDLRKVHYDESTITGSSGGNPFDTKRTLELITRGDFDVGTQVKVVGDLTHAAGFLERVRDKAIDGKALIYPHASLDSPLELEEPWTREREREHLATHGGGSG